MGLFKKNINVISDHHRFFNNLSEKIPYQWDESSYLKINETIPSLISKDFYRSGWEHFKKKKGQVVGTFVKPKDSPLSWRENEFLTDHLDLIYPKKNKSVTGWNFLLKSTFEEKFLNILVIQKIHQLDGVSFIT